VLKIYATPLSANGRKVLAVSREFGLQPENHLVNVYRGEGRKPEYLAINPSGKIPTLIEGEFILFESNAILLYLAEAHGGCRWSLNPGAQPWTRCGRRRHRGNARIAGRGRARPCRRE
jgi:glutathione S-transferase